MLAWRERFGDFDPFGDFELLFPASLFGLGIVDIPVRYRDRIYGSTNIRRFHHGLMLLKMTLIGFLRIRCAQQGGGIDRMDNSGAQRRELLRKRQHRAKARAFALAIACDIHPVQNLKVLARLRELGLAEEKVTEWAAWANREGLAACERLVAGETGPFCFGAVPTIADLCLVPQLANARRFGVDVNVFPRLLQAEAAARAMPAFADAAPDRQADAE